MPTVETVRVMRGCSWNALRSQSTGGKWTIKV